ncbi:hypothetical protein [Actinoplanes italicus]|nr:hypothetical protein [Actinoplanes italicus]
MSFRIPLRARAFPSYIHVPSSMTVSKARLVWASVTMGRQNWADVMSPKGWPLHVIWRASMVMGTFDLSGAPGSPLTVLPAYTDLDGTEKVTVSYFMGGVAAKLFAEELGVPWLVHFDRILRNAGVSCHGSRPDFIGIGTPPFSFKVTVEAKGTARTPQPFDVKRAKGQLKAVRARTSGRRIAWANFSILDKQGWRIEAHDPDPEDTDQFPSTSDLLASYYEPVARSMEARADLREEEVRAEFPEVGVAIRFPARLFAASLESDGEAIGRFLVNESRLDRNFEGLNDVGDGSRFGYLDPDRRTLEEITTAVYRGNLQEKFQNSGPTYQGFDAISIDLDSEMWS